MVRRGLRVAVVVPSFPALSETFIVRKVAGLVAAGVSVCVLASELGDEVETGADARTLSVWRANALRRHPVRAAGLLCAATHRFGLTRRAARAFSYALPLVIGPFDLVHFEFSGIGLVYQDALAVLPEMRVVVSCRGAAEQIAPTVDPSRRARLVELFDRADMIHAVSDDMAQTVRDLGADDCKVVVNRPAVDAGFYRRTTPWKHGQPARLLSVGRLHWKKGYDVALMAIKQLLEGGWQVRYDVIGEGPEREKLYYMVADLGLSAEVSFVGARPPDAVRNALQDTTLFVLPSLSEGISNAVLEAMAMEVPVVTTSAGGMKEVITDGVNGFMASPYDVGSLAGAVERALGHPRLGAVGRTGRRGVEESFTLDRQIATFVDAYHRVAGDRSE